MLLLSGSAAAQSVGPSSSLLGDPQKCVVVLENIGDVGFRISDAQITAEAILTPIKKRVGAQAAIYEGVLKSTEKLQKMLGNTAEGAGPQQEQIAFYKACAEAAPWRITARFGKAKGKAGKHWIEARCMKKGSADAVDILKVEGGTFVAARDALAKGMPGFCMEIPDIAAIPFEPPPGTRPSGAGPPGLAPKKEPKAWTPPPRRD